ncbi:MAG: hypothetical protein A2600_09185 [Candidatus Lambdaproteobacteria bacterium RIFOXYD1_FULL_56_27]|uniref:N-acetyltransferase domain-containing protein n=1 Tax=Candidatus Lambdaproteobacteria bacterium RIFOXYD2_FULL_56_26 TaxID=1817773 RepID=A0A1F6GLB4_9PROT|nr:MAG: hypothetical protein A2557_13310 [Candidatus Lambdaproteobacteria bacterium RIFOXYD2_FULL_56_26]OGH03591.1 MAG: hypothetical protein A2426_06500 [Candidatus Lambdaproteobacteria bacterium RIFOXYC1_FULL_56_13]OGH08728.1 MAG: hypothetical protein A2600_09185 [Candidatus Lambdaproteobacteria bacterium RIFOXYD1_FULL_56_27]
MTARYRYGKPQDLLGLLALEQAAFGPDCFDRQLLVELLTQDRSAVFVAEESGRLLGVVYLLWKNGPGGEYGRVFSLAVLPQAQGLGIGAQLMALAEREAQARGANRLVLEVREENRLAQSFYHKLGYRQTQRAANFYPDGAAALKFKKSLSLAYPPGLERSPQLPPWATRLVPPVPSPLGLATQALKLGLEVRLLCPYKTRPPGTGRPAEQTARTHAFAQGLGWGGYRFTGADLKVGWMQYAELWLFFSPDPDSPAPSWWRLLELEDTGLVLQPLGGQKSQPLKLAAPLAASLLAPKNRAYRALLLLGPSGPASSAGLR